VKLNIVGFEEGKHDMQKPKVSIIIPTYNRSKLISRSIDSVLTQTYQNVETIVIDDGSTDDTLAVLAKYGQRIKVISQPNGGVSKARNTGLSVATGDYIGFLDSDDYYLPAKIEEQVSYHLDHPEIDISLCGWKLISEQDKSTSIEYTECPVHDVLHEILWKSIYGLFPPLIALFKRQCLERVNGFDTSLAVREEQDFWLRMALAGYRFGMVEKILCVYVDSADSKGKNLDRVERAMINILDKVYTHPALPPDTALLKDEIFARTYLHLVRPVCHRSNADASKQIEIARSYANKSFQNHPDITNWRNDTVLPLLNLALDIDLNDPAGVLLRILSDISDENIRSNLLSRLYVVLAFRAYTEKKRLRVLKFVLKAFQKSKDVYKHRGARSIFIRSIIPLPLQSLKVE